MATRGIGTLTDAQVASDAKAQAVYPSLAAYPGLLAAVENQESGGDVNATGTGSSAAGPFQFVKGTAAQYGLTTGAGGTVYDQDASAAAAASYFNDLLSKPGATIDSAIQSYSGGSYSYSQLAANNSEYLGANATAYQGGIAAPAQFPNANNGNGTTTGAVTTSSGSTSYVQAVLNFVSEFFLRTGVVVLGLGLIVIALFWMFASAAVHEFRSS